MNKNTDTQKSEAHSYRSYDIKEEEKLNLSNIDWLAQCSAKPSEEEIKLVREYIRTKFEPTEGSLDF